MGASIIRERLKENSTLDKEIQDINPHSFGINSKNEKVLLY